MSMRDAERIPKSTQNGPLQIQALRQPNRDCGKLLKMLGIVICGH